MNNWTQPYKPSTRALVTTKLVPFICTGGNVYTIKNAVTARSFTYKAVAPKDGQSDIVFIHALFGPAIGHGQFNYIGFVRGGQFYWGGAKAAASQDDLKVVAWAHVFNQLMDGKQHPALEIWNEYGK